MPIGYYRAKVVQERVVTESAVPWSVLRATQFHPLIAYLFLANAWRQRRPRRLLPLRLPMIGPVGRPLREGALTAPSVAAGGQTFEQWLSGPAPQASS